jgi:DNA-binding NarL/FixJ family response regulator
MRALIADDHEIIRRGLKQILTDDLGISRIDDVDSGEQVLPLVRNNSYNVVILDISMPGKSGIDVLREIKFEFPDLPVLVLSIHPEDQYALRVMKNGASGYLNKASAPEELVTAIRKITSGSKYITSAIADQLLQESVENNENPHDKLSNREYQVMLHIASGKTVSEIAEVLNLSVKTVSTYRTRILEKLHLENNARIIHYALSRNLI